jgi:6-hydroxycyclohex-1-ene-1-carbonyl-CoA dehydrogenase
MGESPASAVIEIQGWQLHTAGEPLDKVTRQLAIASLADGDVVVKVAGCGVCHTDLGFAFDGVRTGHSLPLTLGHEIAGTVVAAGKGALDRVGESVVIPAVIPCGDCAYCQAGYGRSCRNQIFPGCDVHGGFASHVVVPSRGLCTVDLDRLAKAGLDLAELSVIADAVTTPYQAIELAKLEEGDVAIFVGVGGVGNFGVQIAAARGAHVVAIDIDDRRLEALADLPLPVSLSLNVRDMDSRTARKAIQGHVNAHNLRPFGWKIFETSGTKAGQEMAFGLLTFGSSLGVVGYTLDTVTVRLSNLMAFDAVARGNWGCLPEHYVGALDLVLDGKIALKPMIEKRPMSTINATFNDLKEHKLAVRPVLIPDFD